VQEGGTLLIGVPDFDYIDPALALPRNPPFSVASWPVEDATCALLLRYPVGAPPVVRYNLVPEVATAYPVVSGDGKTYTFTIRKGFRFSNGAPVTAQSYADAVNRNLSPLIRRALLERGARALDTPATPAAAYLKEVVGAGAVQNGSARTASGVMVKGNRLIIRLTKRTPDFPARMTMPYFCPVPAGLPVDPEGVSAPLPGSGPYYIAEFVRGSRVVLERNAYYRGARPHHLDRIVVRIGEDSVTTSRNVEADEEDVDLGVPSQRVAELAAKYGVNNKRYYSIPSPSVFYVVMNTSRPLFKDNVKLRQAVNFAIDRTALRDALGPTTGSVTDDYLPTVMPGYVNGRLYPLGRPDVTRAQQLARGHARGGTAVMYVCEVGACLPQAQIIKANLKQIGINVELKDVPNAIATAKVATYGDPFDLFVERHTLVYVDPSQLVDVMFDGRTIRATGNTNASYFTRLGTTT
jgi:peptide/nickel transport system substrate-binding protein